MLKMIRNNSDLSVWFMNYKRYLQQLIRLLTTTDTKKTKGRFVITRKSLKHNVRFG